MPLVLDTDIASDVDDALALAVLFGSPEVDLIGCTTVYGDTLLRARVASRFVRLAGRELTVVPGETETLSGREVWWGGHEGSNFVDLEAEKVDTTISATDFLLQRAAEHHGELDILCIGPLTNIARAIDAAEQFTRDVRRLYIMGGRFDRPDPEHNLKSDVRAAQIVFESGIPITVTGLDITTQAQLSADEVATIAAAGLLGAALAAEIDTWWTYTGHEWNNPHDPIAALTLITPQWYEFTSSTVVITEDGTSVDTPNDSGTTQVTSGIRPVNITTEILRRIVAAGE